MSHLAGIVRAASASFEGRLGWRLASTMGLGALAGACASIVPALVGFAIHSVVLSPAAAPPRGLSAALQTLLRGAPPWAAVVTALLGSSLAIALTVAASERSSRLAGDVTAALRIAMLRRAVHASPRDLDAAAAALGAVPSGPLAPGRSPPAARGADAIKLSISRDSALVSEFVVAVVVGFPQAVVGLATLGFDMIASGAWIALAGGFAFFLLSRLFAARAAGRVSHAMRGMQQTDTAVFGALQDSLGAIEDLRLLGARDQAGAEFAARARDAAHAKARVARAVAASGQIKSSFSALSPLLIVVVLLLAGQPMPAGDVAKLLLLVPLLLNRLEGLDALRTGLAERDALLRATLHVLQLPESPARPAEPASVEPSRVRGAVRFDRITFTPPGSAKRILDQLDLAIPAGAVVGICGASGCGKSTLLRLLLRLDDPDDGSVSIDGTDVRAIDPDLLPRIFGVLGQSSRLFERSIAWNLSLGLATNPSPEALSRALRRVRLDDLAAPAAPGRSVDTVFRSQPPNLSGGEQRRLLMARMLARESRVLLLDEPESGLPSATAEELLREVATVAEGRTCLVVTHAPHVLDSLFNVVMDGGKVVGQGTHAQLASDCEPYRVLLADALKKREPAGT